MAISQKEQGLRRRIGTKKLLGCYTISPDGNAYFSDIRGEEGDRVTVQWTENLVIPFNGETLKEGEFYSFSWHLEEEEFVVDDEPVLVENNDFLNTLYQARLGLSGNNLETFNNFQKTIFDEVTGAQHTYIYELLQNANDYPYDGEKVKVNFILTDNYLFFTHTGAPFNLRNVVGITSINQGEKKKNVDTIGYKGIGFKTVFVNNEYVYLRSADWSFRFDKKYSEIQFSGECPWALMPVPTSETELDSEVKSVLKSLDPDMRVQFALRHKHDARRNLPQLKKVFDDNQILLFIPHVGSVNVIAKGYNKCVSKDEEAWIVTDYSYPIPHELRKWVTDNIDNGNKVPEKFKDIAKVRISFAVQRGEGYILPVEDARVYNYLPTELRLGFGFLINADFIPNGSRSGLHDVEWNNHIMQQAGVKFAEWWTGFMAKEEQYDLKSVFALLPRFENNDNYGKLFLKGFFSRVKEIPCIPAIKDGKYKLCLLSEILQDRIEFFNGTEMVMSDEDFYKYYPTTLCLPHPALRRDENFLRFIDRFGPQANHFNVLKLEKLINISKFYNEWLKEERNNIRFNGYLISSTFIREFIHRGLFLTNTGRLGIAGKLYTGVEKYLDDLDFLDGFLPRLNDNVKKGLSNYPNWDTFEKNFIKFDTNKFAREVLENFGNYHEWFETMEESVKFTHFLATTLYQGYLPEKYPFFNNKSELVLQRDNLYQSNELGEDFKNRKWINPEWIQFVNPDYFYHDSERVAKFLANRNIKALTSDICYKSFISNSERIKEIAERIQTPSASVDFYRYLWRQQSPYFSPEMKTNYTVLVTDGDSDAWVPLNVAVFKQDEEWENLITKSWMPEECCWGISDIYYEGLEKKEKEVFESYLAQRSIVQNCTVRGLFSYMSGAKRFPELFDKIDSVERSKEFLAFLWEYNKETFNTIKNGEMAELPVAVLGSKGLFALKDFNSALYIPNDEVLELYEQEWFDKSQIRILEPEYKDLFYGDRYAFFGSLGIKKIDLISYIRNDVIPNLKQIRNQIYQRSSNLAFHKFFASIQSELSEKEMKPLQEMPIYISAPEDELGIMVESSTNHYMPSPMLTEIIGMDIVPLDIMDSIHPDYISNEAEIKYFSESLENADISLNGFVEYISKNNSVAEYLADKDRNIRFWKWVVSNITDKGILSTLSQMPILDNNGIVRKPDILYISNAYVDSDVEEFIRRFVSGAFFISEKYYEEDENVDWLKLFTSVGVNVSTKDILFKDVVPNLSQFKDSSIVVELSKNVGYLKKELENNGEKLKNHLSHLQLLCSDGLYRTPKEAIVTGQYFDIEVETYPDIQINNIVSDTYIEVCGDNHNLRRQVIDLIKLIGDIFNSKCETSTSLRRAKLEYYSKHQLKFLKDNAHYRIIAELATDFNTDRVGIRSILEKIDKLDLMNENEILRPTSVLYLGSTYAPQCDYQKYGVSDIEYVTDKYRDFGTHFSNLFRELGVKDDFTKDNISALEFEDFAEYFWTLYVDKHTADLYDILTPEELRNVLCIPAIGGVKKPSELYYTGNPRLNKIIESLPKGYSKQPRIDLPGWIRIGLRTRLMMEDCLEYLKIETLDYRQDVMNWIYEDIKLLDPVKHSGLLYKFKCLGSEFAESATWYTGAKKWAPLKNLVALEWSDGRSQLKDNFGGNAFICNPSNMPETKQVYDKICDFLEIKVLTDKDFQKKKDGVCCLDIKARNEIDKRLLYIAYQIDNKHWKDTYKEMHRQLFDVDLCKCERILYYYNENISSDEMYSYIDDSKKLWYVGEWDGKRFQKILEWIINSFHLKKYGFTIASLEKMFEIPMNQYLKKNEGGVMPDEFLSMLGEADKAGLEIDKNAEYEEGIGDEENDSTGLSEERFQRGREDRERRKANEDATSHKSGHHSPEKSYTSDNSENDKLIPGTTESSLKKTELKSASTPSRNHTGSNNSTKTDNQSVPNSNYNGNNVSETSNDDISLEEKMEQKWDAQRKKGVQRAKGSGYKPKEESPDFELKGKTSNTSENPNFFSGKKWNDSPQYADRDKSSEVIRRRHTEAQNSADNAMQQLNLYDIWRQSERYSFRWFKYLMELQFQEMDKKIPAPVQIDFHDWMIMDGEQKVLRIVGPSRGIPKWLEDAQYFKVTLLGSSYRKLDCAVLSVDGEGMELLIEPTDLLVINQFEKIRINAQNHTNFIDSLQTSFLDLNYDDDYRLDDNLPDDIQFIYGPPGTGKTTRLVTILSELIRNSGAHRLNVLVLTPTNKAADVIAEKLYDDTVCHDSIVRFGYTDCPKLLNGEYPSFENRDTLDLDNRDDNIVVTTMARYAYDTIQPDALPICEVKWDYIIVDEASMIDIVPITYVLHKGHGSKFIIAGDPKQITPIPQHNMPAFNIYNMVGLDSFKEALSGTNRFPVEGLTIQHRSIPVIGNLVSAFCYQRMVENDTKRINPKPLELDGLRIKPLNFLGFKVQEMDMLYELSQLNNSAFHLYSAIFAYNMASYMVDQIGKKYTDNYSIGIVCPYKAQADAIQQLLENKSLDNGQCKIICGTVHKFQGDECDIMMLVLNPPPKTYSGSHINNENIINVAMSRARDYIFFLMPEKEDDGYELKDRLGCLIDNNDRSIHFCGDVEKVIFGDSDYIYNNTSIHCHQAVNVFYDNRVKYEVRISDTALDIQIND